MTRVAFSVPGKPKGKGRARMSKFGGRPFTPKATREAEKAIGQFAMIARGPAPLMTGTVSLTIEAVFPIPKSWPKALQAAALAGEVEFTGKPDRDNLEKLVADSCNGILWLDDCQVNRGLVFRRYGDLPRVDVTVEEQITPNHLKTPSERARERKLAAGPLTHGASKKRAKAVSPASELLAIGRRIK